MLDGYAVSTAFDGEAGLKAAFEHVPDAIILDVLLPKIDGFEVLRRLRANSNTEKVPVLMLTNLGEPQDVKRGIDLGANGYLIKAHFVPAEVVEKVAELINKEN